MTTARGQYERVAFLPSDVGFGPVTVRDAEGRVIRRITVKTLLAQAATAEKLAEAAARRLEQTTRRHRQTPLSFLAKRHGAA